MYIQPNTTIRLLTGVPLDNTYAHTVYFANATAQRQYFESKGKQGCLFSNQSYQRYAKGTIRLSKSADDIYDCNYMMFQNTSYGNRWFYAFINNINYVSNNVCEIEYEIDVIQTWFFDVTLLRSFVEREHSATDVAGDNIVPEPVPIGEYYMGTPIPFFDSQYGYDIILACSRNYVINNAQDDWFWTETSDNNYPLTFDNQKCMLYFLAFNMTKDNDTTGYNFASFIQHALSQLDGDYDSIACAYLIPHEVIHYDEHDAVTKGYYNILTWGTAGNQNMAPLYKNFFSSKPTTLSHGYTPKNKKLLTYPYNKFIIDTADGNTYDYAFEFFEDETTQSGHTSQIRFKVLGTRNINCSFKCVPLRYKGQAENFTEGCTLTDFPTVGLIIDSFKAWFAQNKTRVGLQIASDILGIGTGAGTVMAGAQILTPKTKVLSVTGAKMMGRGYDEIGKNGVRGIGGILAEMEDRSHLRYKPRLGSSDGSLEIMWNKKDFVAMQESVTLQNAEIIDDFFNCYGYATHRVKIPNRNVRPHWTFVKTIDINLESNAPADDTNKIASIYDNGITFWANASEVGRYDLDNSPVT